MADGLHRARHRPTHCRFLVDQMKFRSLQVTLTAFSGLLFVSLVCGLMLYFYLAGNASQRFSQATVREQLELNTRERLLSQARERTAFIQRELSNAVDVTRALALQLSVMADLGPAAFDRAHVIELLKRTLQSNPTLVATFAGVEPGGLDGRDELHIGQPGHSPEGRMVPVWLRSPQGTLELADMRGMESEKRGVEGVREGAFYLCPKARRQLCVLDPIGYPANDKVVLLPAFSAPIMLGDRFIGMAGADPSIEFIQQLAQATSEQLFNGAAQVAIFASNLRLMGYSADPGQLNQPAQELLDADSLDALTGLQWDPVYRVDRERDLIELFMPFHIGDPETRWTLMIQLPRSLAMASLADFEAKMQVRQSEALREFLLLGGVVALVGLFLVWLLARSIVRPIAGMQRVLDDMARGDGDLTIRLEEGRADELGDISRGFNQFLAKLQGMVGQVISAVVELGHDADGMQRVALSTGEASRVQQAEIEQVATAINEMAATAQDVARNAQQTSISTEQAREAALSGQQLVMRSTQGVEALAAAIDHSLELVEGLSERSNDIQAIVVVIRELAEQTNLLALNAAIEAARAGEQGRGFAVVADEVRHLAQRSHQATQDIQGLIGRLLQGTQDVVEAMQDCHARTRTSVEQAQEGAQALGRIAESVRLIADMSAQIASSAQQQSAVSEDLNQNIVVIGQAAASMNKNATQTAQAGEAIARLAQHQRNLVEQFHV